MGCGYSEVLVFLWLERVSTRQTRRSQLGMLVFKCQCCRRLCSHPHLHPCSRLHQYQHRQYCHSLRLGYPRKDLLNQLYIENIQKQHIRTSDIHMTSNMTQEIRQDEEPRRDCDKTITADCIPNLTPGNSNF